MMQKPNKLIVTVVAVLAILILALAAFAGYQAGQGGGHQAAQHIENVFVDVNGDKLPDLILAGEVILNPGPFLTKAPGQ